MTVIALITIITVLFQATEVHFMYNQVCYGHNSLLSPQMREWQGEALYAYNNAMFSEEDYLNISNIGIGPHPNTTLP